MKCKAISFIPLIFFVISLSGLNYINEAYGEYSLTTVPAFAETIHKNTDEGKIAVIIPNQEKLGNVMPAENIQPTENMQPAIIIEEPSVSPVIVEAPRLRFMAVGDIMLGRSVGKRLEKTAEGYKYAFANVQDIFKKGDVVFANLETPITSSTHGLNKEKKIVLKCNPGAIEALIAGEFNLLSLSNNHILDYYDTGLFDTMALLEKNGIAYSGAGKNLDEARKPTIIVKNGLKIGLLSYTDMAQYIYSGNPNICFTAGSNKAGIIPRKLETIREDIARIRNDVDILAVSLHWGVEESFTVTPEQIDFAHKLLDDGVDLILGHHPHQFQGIEIYKGKPIFYSMGNFMFDQNDTENMESFILDIGFTGKKVTNLSAIPVRIVDKNHVVKQTGVNAQNILSREIKLCKELGTACSLENNELIFDMK